MKLSLARRLGCPARFLSFVATLALAACSSTEQGAEPATGDSDASDASTGADRQGTHLDGSASETSADTGGGGGAPGAGGSGTGGVEDTGSAGNIGGGSDAGQAGGPGVDGGAGDTEAGSGDGGITEVVLPEIPHNGKVIYVSPTGKDTNPGTLQAPVLTIVHAVSLAGANGDVVLLDGVYDGSTQPNFFTLGEVKFSDGVTLRAQNPRKAILRGDGLGGGALDLYGLNAVIDVRFESFGTAIRQHGGALFASGVVFNRCAFKSHLPAAIEVVQSARALLVPDGVTNYVDPPSGAFASVDLDAQLEIRGGSIVGTTPDPNQADNSDIALFSISGSDLILNGVTVGPSTQRYGVSVSGATIQLRNKSVVAGFDVGATSDGDLIIDDSSLTGNGLGYVAGPGLSTRNVTRLRLVNARIQDNESHGISTRGGLLLESTGSQISGNGGSGIVLTKPSTVVLTDTSISNNAAYGLRVEPWLLTDETIKIRGTHVTGNGFAGLSLEQFPIGVDLGWKDDGNNVFQNNGRMSAPDAGSGAGTNVFLGNANITAVGNTWEPNEQGADGQGRYSVDEAGAHLSYTSINMPSGRNFFIRSGSIVVAAKP